MDIEYHLTEADILALTQNQLQHAKGRRNPAQMRRFAYFFGFALTALGMWLLLHDIALAFIFLAFAIISLLFYPVYFDWLIRRKVSNAYRDEKNRATLAKRTLRAKEDGLEESSAWGEIRVKWDMVNEIRVTPTHTFIAIMGKAPSMVIPRDGIITGDYEGFISACQDYKLAGAG